MLKMFARALEKEQLSQLFNNHIPKKVRILTRLGGIGQFPLSMLIKKS